MNEQIEYEDVNVGTRHSKTYMSCKHNRVMHEDEACCRDSVYMISRRMYNNGRLRIVGNDILTK